MNSCRLFFASIHDDFEEGSVENEEPGNDNLGDDSDDSDDSSDNDASDAGNI